MITLPLKPWQLPKMGWNFTWKNYLSHLSVDTIFIGLPFYLFVYLGQISIFFFGLAAISCRIWHEIGNGVGAIDYLPCENDKPIPNYYDPSDLLPSLTVSVLISSIGSYLMSTFVWKYQLGLLLVWFSYLGIINMGLIILNLFMEGVRFFEKLDFLNRKKGTKPE